MAGGWRIFSCTGIVAGGLDEDTGTGLNDGADTEIQLCSVAKHSLFTGSSEMLTWKVASVLGALGLRVESQATCLTP